MANPHQDPLELHGHEILVSILIESLTVPNSSMNAAKIIVSMRLMQRSASARGRWTGLGLHSSCHSDVFKF
jgi:hypothetical protein